MHSEDTRNLLLAIAIVVAMLVGYQIFLAPKVTPEPATRTQQNLEAEGKEPAPGSTFIATMSTDSQVAKWRACYVML